MSVSSVFVLNSCRSQYFSPLDDLAFDMYQDPDVAQMIRQLERKKQDAVSSEHNIGILVSRYEKYNFVFRLKRNSSAVGCHS